MMVAIRTPYAVASARPSTADPRMRMRVRQSINELKREVSIHATRIDGAVISPSNRLVTNKTGIRINDGKMPK